MTVLENCVEFVCRFEAESAPANVIVGGKNAILDTVSAILSGVREPVSRKILNYTAKDRAAGPATVVGTGCRFSAASAALVNGTMAHAIDYDDILTTTRSHPSAVLVPTVLAMGESLRSSGRQVIGAYLVGLEVIDKVGSLVAFPQYAQGWHTTSTIGVFGAAAAAGKLLGLSERELKMALGAAASMAGGLKKNFGTMTKPLHCGLAAQSGIMAATLAADGFTASEEVFDGDEGYAKVLTGHPVTSGLLKFGDPFAVISPGLYFKRYPCCFGTHRAIDAILEIKAQNPWLKADDVAKITCTAPATSFTALIHDCPQTGLEAKFSMQYTVAAGFLDGSINVHSFSEDKVRRREVQSLMSRVHKAEDPALAVMDSDGTDRRFVELTLETTGSQILRKRVTRSKGSADHPLSPEEMSEKFMECGKGMISAERQRATLEMLRRLEELKDVSELMASLGSEERQDFRDEQ